MKKEAYLNKFEVKEFVKWLAKDINLLTHSYKHSKDKVTYSFKNLTDALSQYNWAFNQFPDCRDKLHICKTKSLEENAKILNFLKIDLETSLQSNNFEIFRKSAIALMCWGGTHRTRVIGGVPKGNIPWFENESNLIIVHQTLKILSSQNDDIHSLRDIGGLRFNSGLTKLYSLLIDDFIIYDSRVAAALAWFVLKFKEIKNLREIPDELKFACMRDGSHIRNPLPNKNIGFSYTEHTNPSIHAQWNIRASWILSEAVKLIPNSDYYSHKNVKPIRALEAALFMWGYDLRNSL